MKGRKAACVLACQHIDISSGAHCPSSYLSVRGVGGRPVSENDPWQCWLASRMGNTLELFTVGTFI